MTIFKTNGARPTTSNLMLIAVVAFLAITGNVAFHSQVLKTYSFAGGNTLALLTLPLVVGAFSLLLLAPFCFGKLTKPVLGTILILSSLAAYFMDSFGVVINDDMLRNAAQTNFSEARDLLSLRLVGYLVLLGVLPTLVLVRMPLQWRGWRIELLARLKLLGAVLVVMVALVLAFGGFYASFLREHKALRSYVNPSYYLYSAIRLAKGHEASGAALPVKALGTDANIPGDPDRELVILVVGETARADRFSLNGYGRETNPRLRQEQVFSFPDVWACGTSTAVSVPCMFSLLGADNYDERKAGQQENVLDVLKHAGVYIHWLDNNSDSKGVATRFPYESYRNPDKNPQCDEECRDEGMLSRIQEVIDAHPSGDILIVLHQMGNHGPAYYKRYPAQFEKFVPACKSADLSQCSEQEIGNAYDNAILYTDHFLGEVIATLKRNDDKFEAAMFYVSDHGESLGEKGLFLHGMPKSLAPDSQLHVPAIMWFGRNFDDLNRPALEKNRTRRFTHDHLSHTLLGLMEVQTALYRRDLDILENAHLPDRH